MPKTSIRNDYLEKIAFVNDQLCYFQFADDEVGKIISKIDHDTNYKKMANDVFPENQYSKRINVNFSNLLEFRKKAMATSVGLSLSLGVEYFIDYMLSAKDLKLAVSNETESNEKSDNPEDRMLRNLEHWGCKNAEPVIFKTIKYLRLRRNHIIHARMALSDEFERFLRTENHHLMSYWNKRTSLIDLDFSEKNIKEFTDTQAYVCMKLLRVCLEEVDCLVASTFKTYELVNVIVKQVLSKKKHLTGSPNVLARKVRLILRSSFQVEVDIHTLNSLLPVETAEE